jgi:hypothetical protein
MIFIRLGRSLLWGLFLGFKFIYKKDNRIGNKLNVLLIINR